MLSNPFFEDALVGIGIHHNSRREVEQIISLAQSLNKRDVLFQHHKVSRYSGNDFRVTLLVTVSMKRAAINLLSAIKHITGVHMTLSEFNRILDEHENGDIFEDALLRIVLETSFEEDSDFIKSKMEDSVGNYLDDLFISIRDIKLIGGRPMNIQCKDGSISGEIMGLALDVQP